MLIILCLIVSWAQIAAASEPPIDFELGPGYRADNLHWNISGDLSGQNPNILSELTWSNISVLQMNGLVTIPLGKSFFMQGSLSFGSIPSGKNQDSDYLGNNRTEEFSRSYNNVNGDNALDLSIAVSRALTVYEGKLRLTPLIGYSLNQQILRMTDGYQAVNIDPDTKTPEYTGPFSGLNSTYKASWIGPWLGVVLNSDLNPAWRILGGFEYHWAEYDGEGNWNLRDDLAHPVSFTHYTAGNGYRWAAGVNFSPRPHLRFSLKFISNAWSAGSGIDQTFGTNGDTASTRLNEIIWTSQMLVFTVNLNLDSASLNLTSL